MVILSVDDNTCIHYTLQEGQTCINFAVWAGASLKSAGSYLAAAGMMGLLKPQSQNGLNLVSAPALGKSIGIKVRVHFALPHLFCQTSYFF